METTAQTIDPQTQPTPESILQTGLGFWASKTLLTAVNLKLFTILEEKGKLSASEIKKMYAFKCTDRNVFDFLDALTALGFLEREGILETAYYSNTRDTAFFLDKQKPSYLGGILEMANGRLYPFWGNLETALKTGELQNEAKDGGSHNLFTAVYESPELLKEFIHGMTGVQLSNFLAFAQKFDFSPYKTLADVGGAGAMLCISVANSHAHMRCVSFDLPPVEFIALQNIEKFHPDNRVTTANGDFFKDDLPNADIIVMGNILHDWNEQKKIRLMEKAYKALSENGAFVAIENIIDDERNKNAFGLMMSLNMLIETEEGFDYTYSDFKKWAAIAGFKSTAILPLTGPSSACIAYK